jgi:lipid-binding SYLF domain-containing protein
MVQNPERLTAILRRLRGRLAALMLIALIVPTTPIFAQATGQVRVKIMKAGLLVGGGAGKGVLTYRGRNYPFRVSGLSLGVTVGASFGRLEGWASGIREISDFAGTYNSVGGGAALAGGINGAQLRNDKGVTMVLQGPKAGLEFAANLSTIMISLK